MRNYFKSGKIVFWLGLIFIIYMFVILATETSKNYQLRSKSDELEAQISRLEGQIEDLGYKITYYKTDSYREMLAREKLNVSAPGESVIIIRDEKKQQSNNNQGQQIILKTDQQSLAEKPNYQQWWAFLFGN